MTNSKFRLEKARRLLSSARRYDAGRDLFSTEGKKRVKKEIQRKNGKRFMQTFWIKAGLDLDNKYLKAIESGDIGLAQKIVRDSAIAAGYKTEAYHGTTNTRYIAAKFRSGNNEARNELKSMSMRYGVGHPTDLASVLERWERSGLLDKMGVSVSDVRRARELTNAQKAVMEDEGYEDLDFTEFSLPKDKYELGIHMGSDSSASMFGSVFPFYLRLGRSEQTKDLGTWEPKAVLETLGIGDRYKEGMLSGDVRKILINNGIDSITYENEAEGKGTSYILFSANQIKSASPVVYSIDGKIIPVSSRFDSRTPDFRY